MPIRLAFLCFALWLCGTTASAGAQKGISGRTSELFAWFDKLGFESIGQAKFVHVYPGVVEADGHSRQTIQVREGFLLADDGPTFRVIYLDMTDATLAKSQAARGAPNYCGYEVVSMEKDVKDLLRQMRNSSYLDQWNEGGVSRRDSPLRRAAQLFFLARECERRGFGSLADELVKSLERLSTLRRDELAEILENDFATTSLGQTWTGLNDGSKSWNELAKHFRRIADTFSKTDAGGLAERMLPRLERMAAEETEHQRTGPRTMEGLTAAEKARDLVWRLRDERGSVDENREIAIAPGSTMAALRDLGIEAMPALLDEMRDEDRLSRFEVDTFGQRLPYANRAGLTQYLVRPILDVIAGFSFRAFGYRTDDSKIKVREAAEGWLRAVQAGREEEWLAGVVRGGSAQSVVCAERLHEKYPGAFVDAACAGFVATNEMMVDHKTEDRLQILDLLVQHHEPRVEAFLLDQLKTLAQTEERVAIAEVLRKWGRPEGEEAMRMAWEKSVRDGFAPFAGRSSTRPKGQTHVMLFRMLATSESPETLRLLLRSWSMLSIEYRRLVLKMVSNGRGVFGEEATSRDVHRAFSEELLLAALEDATRLPDWEIRRQGDWIPFPRLCDLAGEGLHVLWPGKFSFDVFAVESVRERQRVRILNGQRRELGLAELPLPPERPKLNAERKNEVVAVEWEEKSAQPDPLLRRQMDGWNGRPLDIDELHSLLTSYAKQPSAGTNRLRVTMERGGDSTGIAVRLNLTEGPAQGFSLYYFRLILVSDGNPIAKVECNGDFEAVFEWARPGHFKGRVLEALKLPPKNSVFLQTEIALTPDR